MARGRGFEESEAVDRALLAFWRAGFEGCSVQDLVTATGLGRQSLYNTFGDKQALFLRALARYREKVDEGLRELEAPGADLATLRRYMEAVLAMQSSLGVGACLMVQTAFGGAASDERVREAIEAGGAAVRRSFTNVLRRCGAARGREAEGTAAYLYAVLHGASALARTGGAAAVAGALDAAFRPLISQQKGNAS